MSLFLDLDAVEIAKGIKEGKWTSLEVTEAYISHIENVNKFINAITETRFIEAIAEAKLADEKIKKGEIVGRLHGVPFSMKDNVNISGMSTVLGLPHRVHHKETDDAYIIEMIKREGGIILCKTNTPALCFYQESENKATGLSCNPWDLSRSVGGSSGGEGALLAVGGAAVGIGTDIGGSIRFPAHYNGVVGFKSGSNAINADGILPQFKFPEQNNMLGIGAMSKSVRDAQLINELLSNKKKSFVDLDAYTFIVPEKIKGIPLHVDTEQLIDKIYEQIAEDFKTIREIPPYFHESAFVWQKNMSIEGSDQLKPLLSENKKVSVVKEFVKEKLTGRSAISAKLSWAMIGADMFRTTARELESIRETTRDAHAKLDEYFNHAILIIPTYHEAAQKHGKQYGELFAVNKSYRWFIPYISYANAWGLPSLVLPAGRDQAGMPISIQLITKNGQEDALFQFGEWFEENIYKYVRCKTYDLVVQAN